MGIELKRSHFVTVVPRFLRSINLHYDWRSGDSASGYIVTPNVAKALEQLSDGLMSEKGQRAFALTGPYGTGKSAFAVFLCQLLGRNAHVVEIVKSKFASEYVELSEKLQRIRSPRIERDGFLLIPVTARRRPIAQLLLEAMLEATGVMEPTVSVRDPSTSRLRNLFSNRLINSSNVRLSFVPMKGWSGGSMSTIVRAFIIRPSAFMPSNTPSLTS